MTPTWRSTCLNSKTQSTTSKWTTSSSKWSSSWQIMLDCSMRSTQFTSAWIWAGHRRHSSMIMSRKINSGWYRERASISWATDGWWSISWSAITSHNQPIPRAPFSKMYLALHRTLRPKRKARHRCSTSCEWSHLKTKPALNLRLIWTSRTCWRSCKEILSCLKMRTPMICVKYSWTIWRWSSERKLTRKATQSMKMFWLWNTKYSSMSSTGQFMTRRIST